MNMTTEDAGKTTTMTFERVDTDSFHSKMSTGTEFIVTKGANSHQRLGWQVAEVRDGYEQYRGVSAEPAGGRGSWPRISRWIN